MVYSGDILKNIVGQCLEEGGMNMMFMGTTNNSIDDKNRMIVPAKLRGGLGNRCILTKGLDRCLYIYTAEAWDAQMDL